MAVGQGRDARDAGTAELIKTLASDVQLLVHKHVELAKTELAADVRKEARAAGGLGVAAIAGLTALNLLLVTIALALSAVLPPWAAGLVVTGPTLVTALVVGAVSWNRRVRTPLPRTRRILEEDVRWTKERMA
jgi:uncharacterized membrane protein YqjE